MRHEEILIYLVHFTILNFSMLLQQIHIYKGHILLRPLPEEKDEGGGCVGKFKLVESGATEGLALGPDLVAAENELHQQQGWEVLTRR